MRTQEQKEENTGKESDADMKKQVRDLLNPRRKNCATNFDGIVNQFVIRNPFMTVSHYFTFRSGCKAPPSSPVSDAKTSPRPEIAPVLKAFGRHIARSFHRGRGVHIPAMKNTAFGQVLRTLELKRAFN
ncbi:Uncharacterised protein [Escherichia coli]|uniref:Uncharacterized protein n=1 Tax=Escherichia coli TaxID=562 RepID=A0AAX2KIN4_ECOLX|nr:Uncharacterised protein [Escherichia coli]